MRDIIFSKGEDMEFFSGLLSSLPTAFELGLFNALVVLALFLSYSMLNVHFSAMPSFVTVAELISGVEIKVALKPALL